MGCGVKRCDTLDFDGAGGTWPNGLMVVCVYGPGGNWGGEKPYDEGDSASDCPTDFPIVQDGLCAREGDGEDSDDADTDSGDGSGDTDTDTDTDGDASSTDADDDDDEATIGGILDLVIFFLYFCV